MDFTLTPYQRLNLYNQYTILEQLAQLRENEDDAKTYAERAEIVSSGYSHDYYTLTDNISEELPMLDAQLVWDTLNLYSFIYSSYDNLKNPTISKDKIVFRGFDGNYETRLLIYCRFIVNELGRYEEFAGDDFNSHCERRETYEKMIQKWNDMGKPYKMTEDQICSIINI